ncbi:MAG: ABC transporter permease [Kiritimatiellae bacterium]|nr:ABC transporter permease [Kiritimatiellia bacterium]
MISLQVIVTALNALRRNILRSVLTMLGIVIGIASVIAMMEIGAGASGQIAAKIANMGSDVLMISPVAISSGGVSAGSGTSVTLTTDDVTAIRRDCPSVKAVTPVLSQGGIQVVRGSRNWSPNRIESGTPDYLVVQNWEISDGACFTERDVAASATVCLLGQTVVDELFDNGESAVGQFVRLNNVTFKVAGVLAKKGTNLMGMDQNDTAIIPWTTMQSRLARGGGMASTATSSGDYSRKNKYPITSVQYYPARDATQTANYPMPIRFNNISRIMASATSSDTVQDAISEISETLRLRHKIADGAEDDFEVRNMSELIDTITSTSSLMTSLLLIVALISLVVGGVGIMNIMFVSVTERTREIGLRMAIGARSSDILTQFLVESVILCLSGGIFGIATGRIASVVISSVLNWPTATSPTAIAMSVAVSAGIGIIFGFYPAWRASKLNPIDALRYE